MKLPLVSIIIPAYNSEKYLSQTILSALAQTWTNTEIVVVDDGSVDGTLALAKTFESEKVRVFHQENKGASAARNKGLLEAKGEFIQFLDADDLLSEGKIEAQVNLLQNKPGFMSTCPDVHFMDGEDCFTIKPIDHWVKDESGDTADFLIKLYGGGHIGPQYGGMVPLHAWLSPKSILDIAGAWNEELSLDDDGEYFCRVLLAAKGIVYSPHSIAYYRKFKGRSNLSAQKNYKTSLSACKSNQLKAKYLLASTNDFKAKIALSRLFWDNAFSFYPRFKDLSREAEKKALELDPDYHFQPFEKGLKGILSKLFGWKATRYLQSLRSQIG